MPKILEDILGERIVEILRNDECSGSQTKGSWALATGNRPNFRHRAIALDEDQRFAFEDSAQDSFGISLHLFDADVHGASSLPTTFAPLLPRCSQPILNRFREAGHPQLELRNLPDR